MRRIDIIKRAGRNLRQAKGRTLLTALAISVGALTISLAMMAGEGGRAYTNQLVSGAGDNQAVFVSPKLAAGNESKVEEYGSTKTSQFTGLSDEDIAKLRSTAHVTSAVPTYATDVTYVQSSGNGKKLMANVTVKNDKSRLELVAGSLENNMPKAGQAVIANDFLESFGFASAQEAIGKTVTLHVQGSDGSGKDLVLTIAAVDKKSDTLVYYSPSVRISSDDAKTLYEFSRGAGAKNEYYSATVIVDDAKNVEAVQKALEANYSVYSLRDVRKTLLQAVDAVQISLMGFGALALLASVFGIINTMYISVLERTSQIGLMKALGMRGRDIGRMFRYEAAWVGLFGGLIGVSLASLATLFNPMLASLMKLGEGTNILIINPLQIGLLILGLVVLAILSGWLPSRKATKLDPIEALRTE